MAEEIIFSSKENKNIQEIGEFLTQIGEKLKNEGSFNLNKGDEKVNINPVGETKLKLKYEIENNNKHELEIEIKWKPNNVDAIKIS
ncbi:MAG: amphi-Trp domain-containing protein [Candidatus Woesearchaeota archaeon]